MAAEHLACEGAPTARTTPGGKSVRELISDSCPYAYYFREVTYCYSDGTLTLQGRVPSFYLKQVLQHAILDQFDNVTRIDNQVDVVSSEGLSST